jgi:hypothetical protein
MNKPRPRSFAEFWPFYVSEHRQPLNRALHFIGSTGALFCLLATLATGQWLLIPAGLVIGYGCAWTGHFFVEHNKPASFKYPLWSFIADWKMWSLMLTGKMNGEVQRIAH